MSTIEKIYPQRGKYAKNPKQRPYTSYNSAAPWKDSDISFNWTNFDYPWWHGHKDWEILLIFQGKLLHKINNEEELLTPGIGCLISPMDEHALFYPDNKKNNFQGVNIIIRDCYLKEFLQMYSPTLYEKLLHHKEALYFSISSNSIEKYSNILLNIQNYKDKEYCRQQCNIVFTYLMLKIMEL